MQTWHRQVKHLILVAVITVFLHPPGGLVDKRLGSRAQGPEFETRRGDGNLTKAYPLEKAGTELRQRPLYVRGFYSVPAL